MAVRQKGRRFMTDVMVHGVRYRASFASRTEAEQYERDIAHAVASGRDIPQPKTTRTSTGGNLDTLGRLFEHVRRTHWHKMSGSSGAISCARHVVKVIGPNTPVADITKLTLQEACSVFFDQGNSVATVNRKMAAASKMLSEALELGIIDRKPSIPKGKEMNIEIRYLTEDDEDQLVTAFKQLGLAHWADFTVVAIDTGMRLGEMLRLRWNHVQGDIVHVWQTKANKPRSIPLTRRALEALERLQERHPDLAGPFATWKDTGGLKRPLRNEWDVGMKVTGLDRRIHDLRHTCASRLVQRGVDLLRVKDYLGHSNIQTTLRYAHLAPTSLRSCRDVLDRDNRGDKRAEGDTRVVA